MAMDDSPPAPGITEADIPDLQDFMNRNAIANMAAGIKAFRRAKADGTDKPGDDDFTQADVPEIEKYCRRNKVDTRVPGQYEAALVRYKAERKAGTLHRT